MIIFKSCGGGYSKVKLKSPRPQGSCSFFENI